MSLAMDRQLRSTVPKIAPFKTFGRRYATRDTFGVFKPALKRGATLDRRYRGNVKPAIGKVLGWKRRSSVDCRYRGKTCPR